jgi:1,4-dihydroxy-2-naphthoyl-CoA synthase
MTIVAKPIIDKQFWILQQGNRKIGNVEACDGGYQVKINNQVEQYRTIKMVEQRVHVHFEPAIKTTPKIVTNLVHEYPASGRVYNPIWDVQKKLPLYTKTNKSKSWFAAGWYCVKKGRHWAAMQGPKLILLQRYPYQGPYYTKEEALKHD